MSTGGDHGRLGSRLAHQPGNGILEKTKAADGVMLQRHSDFLLLGMVKSNYKYIHKI